MASEHDIIVVDDHPLFRRGVIQLLKMDPSFNVVAEAGDFEAAMVAVRERDPDIVLLDLNMKHTSGVEILTAIKTFDPSIRVIMLTVSDSPSDLLQCFQNGADGYLLKDQEPEQILEDIQKAAKGQTVLSASMNQALAECLREESFSKERRVSELTEREKSVLKLIAQGKTNKEIGKALEISDGTVKVHVKHVLHKLSFRSRVEAAVWAKGTKESLAAGNTKKAHDWKFGSALFCDGSDALLLRHELQRGRAGIRSGWDSPYRRSHGWEAAVWESLWLLSCPVRRGCGTSRRHSFPE